MEMFYKNITACRQSISNPPRSVVPPVLSPHECIRIPSEGIPIFFGPRSVDLSIEGMPDRIAGLVSYWKEDGGPVLLTALAGSMERDDRDNMLNLTRLEKVRLTLKLLGVSESLIWARYDNLFFTAGKTEETADNLLLGRVVISIPHNGRICRALQRQVRVEWLEKNCTHEISSLMKNFCREVLSALAE